MKLVITLQLSAIPLISVVWSSFTEQNQVGDPSTSPCIRKATAAEGGILGSLLALDEDDNYPPLPTNLNVNNRQESTRDEEAKASNWCQSDEDTISYDCDGPNDNLNSDANIGNGSSLSNLENGNTHPDRKRIARKRIARKRIARKRIVRKRIACNGKSARPVYQVNSDGGYVPIRRLRQNSPTKVTRAPWFSYASETHRGTTTVDEIGNGKGNRFCEQAWIIRTKVIKTKSLMHGKRAQMGFQITANDIAFIDGLGRGINTAKLRKEKGKIDFLPEINRETLSGDFLISSPDSALIKDGFIIHVEPSQRGKILMKSNGTPPMAAVLLRPNGEYFKVIGRSVDDDLVDFDIQTDDIVIIDSYDVIHNQQSLLSELPTSISLEDICHRMNQPSNSGISMVFRIRVPEPLEKAPFVGIPVPGSCPNLSMFLNHDPNFLRTPSNYYPGSSTLIASTPVLLDPGLSLRHHFGYPNLPNHSNISMRPNLSSSAPPSLNPRSNNPNFLSFSDPQIPPPRLLKSQANTPGLTLKTLQKIPTLPSSDSSTPVPPSLNSSGPTPLNNSRTNSSALRSSKPRYGPPPTRSPDFLKRIPGLFSSDSSGPTLLNSSGSTLLNNSQSSLSTSGPSGSQPSTSVWVTGCLQNILNSSGSGSNDPAPPNHDLNRPSPPESNGSDHSLPTAHDAVRETHGLSSAKTIIRNGLDSSFKELLAVGREASLSSSSLILQTESLVASVDNSQIFVGDKLPSSQGGLLATLQSNKITFTSVEDLLVTALVFQRDADCHHPKLISKSGQSVSAIVQDGDTIIITSDDIINRACSGLELREDSLESFYKRAYENSINRRNILIIIRIQLPTPNECSWTLVEHQS